MSEVAISVNHVSKNFKLPHERYTGLKQALINFRPGGRNYETQHVLKDISFDIKEGEFFGIVGRNGSGKSTLLKLLAQIYTPDEGNIQIHGSLTPFIELGVGFNPELSGRENVFLNGALLGFDRKETLEMYDSIVQFAELEQFMDQKLKNYSSGMQVRLAFSIAIRAKSDILLVDEVLAVGDAAFQTKCFDYFYQLKKSKKTVVFVSHDVGSLARFCDRGILIDSGVIEQQGPINNVLKSYTQIVLGQLDKSLDEDPHHRREITTNFLEISDCTTADKNGHSKKRFSYGEDIYLEYKANIHKEVNNPIFGVTVWEKNTEHAVFATNTFIDGHDETGDYKPGQSVSIRVRLPRGLNDGEFYLEPAVANTSATFFYDQRPKAVTFYISGSPNPHSLLSTDAEVEYKVSVRS